MTGLKLHDTAGVFVGQNIQTFDEPFRMRVSILGLQKIYLIINNDSQDLDFNIDNFFFIHTRRNIGGAGGFSTGMRLAKIDGFEWIWTCDDDAFPTEIGLVNSLISLGNKYGAAVVAPAILSSSNPQRLSFPFRIGLRRVWNYDEIKNIPYLEGQAHLFNGTLFRSLVIDSVGLPKQELFIRGDEIDYLFRIAKHGHKVITVPSLTVVHPSGEEELFDTLFGLLRVQVPNSEMKYFYQFRNRGYLTRKYLRFDWAVVDSIRYASFFLLRRKPFFRLYLFTMRIYLKGFMLDLISDSTIPLTLWKSVLDLREKRPI
jgi:rhamnopyranosyl-N-acetylglucosaminyl-diphospho-decaprenol beta-1,3/1,4-galactofuranosyltransferase